MKDYQIIGVAREAPWIDFYDIAATTPGENAAAEDQVRQMLQGLLADRFQLKLHRETRVLLCVQPDRRKKWTEAEGERPGHKVRHNIGNHGVSGQTHNVLEPTDFRIGRCAQFIQISSIARYSKKPALREATISRWNFHGCQLEARKVTLPIPRALPSSRRFKSNWD